MTRLYCEIKLCYELYGSISNSVRRSSNIGSVKWELCKCKLQHSAPWPRYKNLARAHNTIATKISRPLVSHVLSFRFVETRHESRNNDITKGNHELSKCRIPMFTTIGTDRTEFNNVTLRLVTVVLLLTAWICSLS